MNSRDREELTAFLNEADARASARRRPHHLSADTYSVLGGVYCLTLCARHHVEPFQDAVLAQDVVGALAFYRDRGHYRLHAFCLMPDHLHAVIELQRADVANPATGVVGNLLSRYKRYTPHAAWKRGLHGALWQRDFYDRVPNDPNEVETHCRYVLENPLRKGLTDDWRHYAWSGGEMHEFWMHGQ